MEHSAEIDRAVEEMEWGELVSTLQVAINEILGDTPNPPPPPPSPPPPVPAGLELNTHPQPVESQSRGYGGCIPLGAAPHMFEQESPLMAAPTMYCGPLQENIMQPGHLYSQAGAYSQGQYLPYQWPVDDVPTAAAAGHPAAPPHPYNDVPVVRLPEGIDLNLRRVGVLNGQVLNEVPAEFLAPPVSAAPPLNTSNSKKRKRVSQQEEDRPYVKKPPNAFMLFMKEQRPNVEAEFNIRGSVAVNTVLGQRWKSVTKEEQAKYYDQAEKEHPDWSSSDNYGKKRKRHRSKAPTRAEASASKPEEETQQAKKLCVTPVQTAVMVMEPCSSQAGVMEAPHTQTGVMEPCHLQTVWVQLPHTQCLCLCVTCVTCHRCMRSALPPGWILQAQRPRRWPPLLHRLKHRQSIHSEDVGGQVSPDDGAA